MTKRTATIRARRATGVPAYSADFETVRGRCLARKKGRRCQSRYGLVRLSIDYTDRREKNTLATVECAACGHTWYRTTPPARLGEHQSVLLDLILPSEQRRWYARGRWHVTGEDSVTLRNATWAELMAASADWRKRNDSYALSAAKAKAKKAAAEAAAHEATMALLAKWAEREAAEREAEAAAEARS
jgi:hypothetical protein